MGSQYFDLRYLRLFSARKNVRANTEVYFAYVFGVGADGCICGLERENSEGLWRGLNSIGFSFFGKLRIYG